jgi:hypothetical protein
VDPRRTWDCDAEGDMGVIRRHGWWMIAVVATVALLWPRFAPREEVVPVPCVDIVAGCVLPLAEASIRFDRQPDALKPFHIAVAWPDAREIRASFQMEGMEMGFNSYRLVEAEPGQWRGEVMLPACIQGRKDWQVVVNADGKQYALPFTSR